MRRYVCLEDTCTGLVVGQKGLPERDLNAHKERHLLEGESAPKWRKYRLPDPGEDHFETHEQNPDTQYNGAYDTNDTAAKPHSKSKSSSEPSHGHQTIQSCEST
jgi:hypothetical protein